jgi:putative ATP-dependent endonuclease of the OLD family
MLTSGPKHLTVHGFGAGPMHLESVRLQRFRSCDNTTIDLRPDLTVLVGENNGGKSNIIDAVRLLTLPLTGRRDRYPEDEDLRRGSQDPTFVIEGRFSGLSDTVKGLLISAVPDPVADLAILGMRYQVKSPGFTRGRTMFYAGKFDTAEPEPGATDLIRHVFLPPLRDARLALGSASATRITALLQHFLNAGEEDEFLSHVRRPPTLHRVVNAVNTQIGSALGDMTRGVRAQAASLGFAAEALSEVARDLRFRLADAGVPLEDIRSSGLGYANLLYVATVAVELAKAREADLTLFLVEEPEAHLHPQLQMLVLDFLLAQARMSVERPAIAGEAEGRIQVVVTTHSPNLTAWVPPEHLVVIRSARDAATPTQHCSVSVPISKLGIGAQTLRKVSRYLDVTRSALLFGTRAVLVEGIAEALLLPVMAKHVVLRGDNHAWQRFRASVLVAIDGVDFAPYVEVLLRPCAGSTVAERVVIVTDADPSVPGNRKEDLEAMVTDWGTADRLSIFTNVVTLEHELFEAGNGPLLRRIFLELYPQSPERWTAEIDNAQPELRASAFVALLKDMKTRKGDLAQRLANLIEEGEAFFVPEYAEQAIRKASEE